MSRKRDTTEEEHALFNETLRDARKIRSKKIVKPARPPAEPAYRRETPLRMPVFSESEAPSIGGHRQAHMRRGRVEPEARLDLHGFTQEEAFRALARFLHKARGLDQRVVLVITGKAGVLRSMVPRWLAEPELAPLTSGLGPAHIKHGGPGAFYVAIRRNRDLPK